MKATCWYGKHNVSVEQVPDPTVISPTDRCSGNVAPSLRSPVTSRPIRQAR